MKIKHIYLAVVIVLLLVLSGLWKYKVQQKQDKSISSNTLSDNTKEKIIIDPNSHKITTITATGNRTQFLPDRLSSIELRKNGDVVLTSPEWGFEHSLFAGFGFSNDGLRFGGGLDLCYWHKIDGGFIVTDSVKDLTKPRIGVILSYIVWHDTRLSVSMDNESSGFFITQRF